MKMDALNDLDLKEFFVKFRLFPTQYILYMFLLGFVHSIIFITRVPPFLNFKNKKTPNKCKVKFISLYICLLSTAFKGVSRVFVHA